MRARALRGALRCLLDAFTQRAVWYGLAPVPARLVLVPQCASCAEPACARARTDNRNNGSKGAQHGGVSASEPLRGPRALCRGSCRGNRRGAPGRRCAHALRACVAAGEIHAHEIYWQCAGVCLARSQFNAAATERHHHHLAIPVSKRLRGAKGRATGARECPAPAHGREPAQER